MVLMMEELLTVKEVAQILRKNPYTIKRHIREKKMQAYMVGGTYRVKREDLNAYIEEQKINRED